MKYRKKPVVIEAFQWLVDEVPEWWRNAEGIKIQINNNSAFIPTLEGTHEARKGDFIIRGVKGEIYPCKPDIFEMTYEAVEAIKERLHIENQSCWCEPTLIQAVDDEHYCEVWSHKGHDELDQ